MSASSLVGSFLGCNSLGDARDDHATSDRPLDEPVFFTITGDAPIHAALTEVKVTCITDAAVIVLVENGLSTIVAVDVEYSRRIVTKVRNVCGYLRSGRYGRCHKSLICGIVQAHCSNKGC